MSTLIVVHGLSGSGKTQVSNYLRDSLGFADHSFDRYVERFCNEEHIPYKPLQRQYRDSGDFFERFWRDRNLPYDMETTRELLREKRNLLLAENLPEEDRFHITYAIYNEILAWRDSSLLEGRDVVINSPRPIDPYFTDLPEADIQKYLVHLKVNPETCAKRLLSRWDLEGHARDEERARRLANKPIDYSDPQLEGVVYLLYENETPEQLQKIKEELRQKLGR